jgi:hypothetical protein
MRKFFYLLGAVSIIFVAYLVTLAVTRMGETKVVVTVIPETASVTLDEGSIDPGTLYLKPGKYTFKASATGWKTDIQLISVGGKALDVNLIPAPDSPEARTYLRTNPDVQTEREKIGGENFNKNSQAFANKNPIVNLLPYTDPAGPFSIDYGASESRKNGVFLVISDSSANGRVNALKWIRQQGYDPTNLEITYLDYSNPLLQGRAKR